MIPFRLISRIISVKLFNVMYFKLPSAHECWAWEGWVVYLPLIITMMAIEFAVGQIPTRL